MSLKLVAACIAFFCAKPFPSDAQGAAKSACIDPAAIRSQQQTADRDAVLSPLLPTLTTTEGQAGQRPPGYRFYLTLGAACEVQHRLADAERYYQTAYTLAKSAFGEFGERSDPAAAALYGVGSARLGQGRIREADVSFRQVLSIFESQNANPLDIAAVLNSMAVVQQMNGNFSKAVALMRRVVRIVEINPAAEPVELGAALSNLATMLRYVSSRPEAVNAAERAGTILECCKNTDHFAANLAIRGLLHLDDGDRAGAESLLLRALRTIESLSKQGSPDEASILTHLGVFYVDNGRHREAEPYLQRALEINQRLLGPDHPRLLSSMGAYAALLRATKRKGEAKRLEAYIYEHNKKYHAENPALANVVDVHSLMNQRDH